ncbi:MAG: prepilin-type N-terminal cleavage/methylation domain-containing protein [Candidatus Saccharimonadales bacterium]
MSNNCMTRAGHGCDHSPARSAGFTLTEIIMVLALIGVLSAMFYSLFATSFFSYLNLQKQASSFTQISLQSSRVAAVVRGLMSISIAKDDELEIYAYFYPSDQYVSKVRYYVVTVSGVKQLRADLTPMTANPPIGIPIVGDKTTTTVIDSFYQPVGTKLFTYLNAANVELATPITDFFAVKSIKIQLSAKVETQAKQTITTQVMLRNRKTNL